MVVARRKVRHGLGGVIGVQSGLQRRVLCRDADRTPPGVAVRAQCPDDVDKAA